MNNCFEKYKNIHKGKSAVLFGTGPSVNEYNDIYNLVKIGSNEIVYKPYIMDYYFIGDAGNSHRGFNSDRLAYMDYTPNIAKFYRTTTRDIKGMPSGLKDGYYYSVTDKVRSGGMLYSDITQGLGMYATISLEALQFSLYTGVKNIYLVGHDCDYTDGSFYDKDNAKLEYNRYMLNAWKVAQSWVEKNYPESFIGIINPIKLDIFPECGYDDIKENR